MIENTTINGNSVDWDAYKIHHNDLVHYIEEYSFNGCADLGEYTGAISQLSKTTPTNNPTATLNVIDMLPARGREQTHEMSTILLFCYFVTNTEQNNKITK